MDVATSTGGTRWNAHTVKGMILPEKAFVEAADRILEGIRIQKRKALKNISGAAKSILNQKIIVR